MRASAGVRCSDRADDDFVHQVFADEAFFLLALEGAADCQAVFARQAFFREGVVQGFGLLHEIDLFQGNVFSEFDDFFYGQPVEEGVLFFQAVVFFLFGIENHFAVFFNADDVGVGVSDAGFDRVFLAFDQRFRIEDVGNFTGDADRNKTSIYHLLAGFYDVFGNAVEDLQALFRVAAQGADSCGDI